MAPGFIIIERVKFDRILCDEPLIIRAVVGSVAPPPQTVTSKPEFPRRSETTSTLTCPPAPARAPPRVTPWPCVTNPVGSVRFVELSLIYPYRLSGRSQHLRCGKTGNCQPSDPCWPYFICGRPDLGRICQMFGPGPTNNCVRTCLQQNFDCATGGYNDPYWKGFGPIVHYSCFIKCGIPAPFGIR